MRTKGSDMQIERKWCYKILLCIMTDLVLEKLPIQNTKKLNIYKLNRDSVLCISF